MARSESAAAAFAMNRLFSESPSNRWLRSMLEALTLQSKPLHAPYSENSERRRESARLWRILLDAIKLGDGERAEKIASTISLAARDAAIKTLEQRDETRQQVGIK